MFRFDGVCLGLALVLAGSVLAHSREGRAISTSPQVRPRSFADGNVKGAVSGAAASAIPIEVAASSPPPGAQAPAAATTASNQPDLAAVKVDFVPGEKIILYDDFSDMAGDEPPPHWKVRGTVAELKTGAGIRQLTFKGDSVPEVEKKSQSNSGLRGRCFCAPRRRPRPGT